MQAVLALRSDEAYAGIAINIFTAKDLEKVFMSLDDLQKQDIIRLIPENISPVIEYEALHETVTYLLEYRVPMKN
ncbi:MAG: hypothetical protein V8S58_01650 [Lachnospiraceae bacterium]